MGDNWLATVVPPLLAQPNVTVLITWDEGSMSTTPPEHLVAVEAGAGVVAGSTDGTAYTHYGLEAGLYRYFGLGAAPNNGATATPLPIPHPAPASPPVGVVGHAQVGVARDPRCTISGSGVHRGHRGDLQRRRSHVHRRLPTPRSPPPSRRPPPPAPSR